MKLPHRRQFLHLVEGTAALPAVSRFAWAQAYPTRPITIIVPFAVGGATDAIARLLAERMRQSLGQPVIVENVTGAGGTINRYISIQTLRQHIGATASGKRRGFWQGYAAMKA